eukprot:TRINITY_DN2819_c0_g1_i9.p1 TRINITY_DN2819_c0_g1~~TRINITY_DN2819_c0_g1_i9.p1  ORF type:complete len:120 (+),score=34.54 TRINITY_DN2819_c0_g1_i9:125-484(+)
MQKLSGELVPHPIIKSYIEESPESTDESKRTAYFNHKKQFLIITAAGKPIYTRYGEEGGASAVCASFAAIVPKLNNLYSDQQHHSSANEVRYIKSRSMLTVILTNQNLIFIGLSRSGHS